VEWLELQLSELRAASRDANGVALAQLKKQEREVFDELQLARENPSGMRKLPDHELARRVLEAATLEWARSVLGPEAAPELGDVA
jgi:hypothetical protein